MFDEDLSVFFDADEFATEFTLVGSSPALTFPALTGEADEETLQGYAVGTERKLQWPTAAASLHKDQILSSLSADGTTVQLWRVMRDGWLVNDGAESVTFIVPHTEA
jgi:hypothetical protein